ncbi:thioester domain-containing protein [Georgenia satyanarayanai]|uniref:thioester domain-containing protein n=1 Tax=Georgenia satyanarayanai TaxID=860221 RepID=UPI002041EF42|nr:thioester domain-containing protein [Georgenia satyanarayanai]MCM3661670.1 thioester domain-containing protein [Georgenia satyanarayanai]
MRPRPANAVARWFALGIAAIVAMMTVVPVAAYADTDTDDYVHIGDRSQAQRGEGIASLFPIFTSEGSRTTGVPDLWAYCIEYNVAARYDTPAERAGWSEFPGDNAFSTSLDVREKIAWIITNSYPTLTLEQLGQAVGVPDLTVSEAVAGTQYAVWKLTDGVDAELSADARTVREHLLGEANVGLPENDSRAEVTLTTTTEQQHAGTLVGPVTVTTNRDSVTVTVDPALPVVDADGMEIELSSVHNDDQLYLDAREESAAGSATIEATATASGVTGSILKVPAAGGSAAGHAQTIILVDAASGADARATLSWGALSDDRLVAPVMPEVTQAVCTEEGDTTTPSITPATTEGVDYSFEGEVQAGGTVQVTATAQKGYTLTAAEGWTVSEDGTRAMTTIELAEVDCASVPLPDVPVAPVMPEVTQGICTGEGDTTTPSIIPATTEGVDYSVEGHVQAGRTVQVTATAQEGYTLTAAEGWTLNDDGTRAMTTVELTEPGCAVAGEQTPGAPPAGRLPSTGANAIMPLAVAGALLLGGAAAVIRRRSLSL